MWKQLLGAVDAPPLPRQGRRKGKGKGRLTLQSIDEEDNDEVDLPETRSIASLEDFASTVLTGRALGPRGMGDGFGFFCCISLGQDGEDPDDRYNGAVSSDGGAGPEFERKSATERITRAADLLQITQGSNEIGQVTRLLAQLADQKKLQQLAAEEHADEGWLIMVDQGEALACDAENLVACGAQNLVACDADVPIPHTNPPHP
eukprot:g8050.t1